MMNKGCSGFKNMFSIFFVVFGLFLISGCASTHFLKMSSDFMDKKIAVKTIGVVLPIDYVSNAKKNGEVFENALIDLSRNNSEYRFKPLRQEDYSGMWDSSIQKIITSGQDYLKEIELSGTWRDKKNPLISKKLPDDLTVFKTLDPQLDALLFIKCNQHYGNPAMYGLFAFGALGGLVAAAASDRDPVIGSRAAADNDVYTSAMLVDLNTSNILWYNFAVRYGLNVAKNKDANNMAKDSLYGLVH